MTINKNNLCSDFTKLPNALITDKTISAKAFRIMVYLRSLPNDWTINNPDIAKKLNLSKEMVAQGLKELTTTGWITRHEQKRVKGQFTNYKYHLYEVPDTVKADTVKPGMVKPGTVKPDTVKPDTVKPDTVKPTTEVTDTVKRRDDGIGVLANTHTCSNTQGTTNTPTNNRKTKAKETFKIETQQKSDLFYQVPDRKVKNWG